MKRPQLGWRFVPQLLLVVLMTQHILSNAEQLFSDCSAGVNSAPPRTQLIFLFLLIRSSTIHCNSGHKQWLIRALAIECIYPSFDFTVKLALKSVPLNSSTSMQLQI